MKFDAMLYSLCRRRKLKDEVAARMGMTGLSWPSVRLLIRLMEVGGKGLLAVVGSRGEFVAARRECLKLGYVREREVANDGTLGSTHPMVTEIGLTKAGRALAEPGFLYLQRLAERVGKVASEQ